jgi:adenylylsulfate reductase subunit B
MCWECYSCVKACPHHAIDVRGYADFTPLGSSVRVHRDEEKGTIAWRIKFRDGKKDFELLAPITTKPWGEAIPQLSNEAAPSNEMRNSHLLFNEPKYIQLDKDGKDSLHTLESNNLTMKAGVYY